MSRLMAHAATEGHELVSGPNKAKGRVDVYGPCYHRSSYGCQWSGPLPEAMLTSVYAEDLAPPIMGRAGPPPH